MRIGPRCNRSKTESLTSLSTHEARGLVHCGVGSHRSRQSMCVWCVFGTTHACLFNRTIEAAGLV